MLTNMSVTSNILSRAGGKRHVQQLVGLGGGTGDEGWEEDQPEEETAFEKKGVLYPKPKTRNPTP